jgi:hypothetical protein
MKNSCSLNSKRKVHTAHAPIFHIQEMLFSAMFRKQKILQTQSRIFGLKFWCKLKSLKGRFLSTNTLQAFSTLS